jgi:uncharacterized membrane protein
MNMYPDGSMQFVQKHVKSYIVTINLINILSLAQYHKELDQPYIVLELLISILSMTIV